MAVPRILDSCFRRNDEKKGLPSCNSSNSKFVFQEVGCGFVALWPLRLCGSMNFSVSADSFLRNGQATLEKTDQTSRI
ncbi:MAG: hypothetical protein C4520_18305 [Candidatus Abyssobacteria bacterium SURF_5]|uniref:Uncharacterized protein n=1 Tax=Abyssobacteria bacterium (strain SURF_5) TaxID=2093360 RepID=A0A3A4ND30_ABYX5|nr:MAG: hypothetical protein C4520_18305 [Candidatus Abyssubacteria bacterium SURF_5]